MIELRVLGPTDLRRDDDQVDSFLAGPKRLGVLTYLVVARPHGFRRRDTVLSLFWPELGQRAARNALSNMLYHIRRELGEDVLVNRGAEEVGIRRKHLWCDAVEFDARLDQGDVEGALALYRGELLEGFHVSGAAPEFSQWLDAERERLRTHASDAAWTLADRAEQSGDSPAMRSWAKKAAAWTPFSDESQRRLIAALHRSGDRAGALHAYDAYAARLRSEWDMMPSALLTNLVEEVRAAPAPTDPAGGAQNVWSRLRGDPRFDELRRRVDAAWGIAPPESGSARLNPRGIAVLPFQELGGNDESAFFASGLHDDLLTKLSRVATLTVIARASVHQFLGERSSIPDLARALGVATVVEGVVRLAGRRVRLNVQLIDAPSEALRWAETYDRELTAENVFDLQNELAEKITANLEAEVTVAERQRVEHRPTENLEAFRLYAHGRQSLDLRSEEAMRAALGYFRRAIAQDARYALAWAGVAEGLSLLRFYGIDMPADAPEAMDAALQAVSLMPELGEAHAAKGIVHAVHHEGPAAVRELERATTLAPGYAEAHIWLGWVRLCLGRHVEAVEPAVRAVQLNPLAPAVHVYLAEIRLANGAEQEALHHANRAREIQPSYGLAHFTTGLVLHHMRRYEEAASALNGALVHVHMRGAPTASEVHAVLAVTLMADGNEARARAATAEIDPSADPFAAGLAAAALGDVDTTFRRFEEALEKGGLRPEYVRYFFPDVLGPLRRDARYDALLRDLGRSWGEE